MTFFKKLYIAILLGLTAPSIVLAAGLGRIEVTSGLGQPLRAEIEIVALQPGEADTLAAALAPAASFRQANVDFTSVLQSIKFAIERRPNNQYVILMTSSQPMNEPFIDLLVELTWSAGRLIREYTFLLDPPELKPTVATPTPPVTPPSVAPLAQVAPQPAAASPVPATSSAGVSRPAAGSGGPKPLAKPAANPAGQYEVKRGDTLAKIASQNMVAGSSLQQMLAALYRGNEDAFDGKNMNRLRTGKILNLSGAEEVKGITQTSAIQMVRSQASEYAEYQRSIGAAVAAAPARAEGSRQSSGKIAAPPADKPAASAVAKDQLRLSKPDDAKGKGRTAGAATADDLVAKDKVLRETQERVALLEKNVQDLQKLLQLKSGGGAQAQKQAEAVKGPAAADAKAAPAKAETPAVPAKAEASKATTEAAKATEPAKPAAEPAKPAAPSDAAKATTADGVKPAAPEPVKAGEPAKPEAEEATAPDVAKQAAKPAAKAPAPPPPPPPSFMDELLDNELALGAAGAAVLALAGYAVFAMRRRKKSAASADFGDSVVSVAPVAAVSIPSSAFAQSEPADSSAETSQSGAGGATSEEIDPIAEADVYMAYGRDTQAEEILKEALAKDVNRTPVWAKLLEVYANRKDLKAFESTATDLQTLTGGQGPDWEKAVALGLQLDPDNALYGGSGGDHLGSTQIMPGADEVAASEATTVVPTPEQAADAAGPALDFDLDLGGDTPAEDAAEAASVDLDLGEPAPAVDAPADGDGSGLDFDLGLDSDKPLAATEIALTAADSETSIDFDLGMSDEAPAAQSAPVATDDSGSTMDFDLNLDETPSAQEASAGATTDIDLSALSLDLGGDSAPAGATTDIDLSALSLDLGGDSAPAGATTDIDLSALSLDLGGDSAPAGAPMDAKWQEVATKLDLAKAYDEMGDKDGARDLLNEVMQEGDVAQKQQAQSMIAALG